ncbi:efflux RND transporter periplasmic adaptor subunit [Polaromonas sp.]|uniref:efflux RND transporter periplasmic adaptor subunit n=1 Tax=Polaromonas sp. TaxID=1869339 RepID=UPI002D78ED55|nr:efflux RND transporter periplasmic adaptor subunit [Polaromonas sp.]
MPRPTVLWLGSAALLVIVAGGWWYSQHQAGQDVQYRTANIERGPLQAAVAASGMVNPVSQVSVGTQVSGQIKDIYADFNAEVKAGQLIAIIDPETFEYRVRSAQADVDAARAAAATQQASLTKARVDAEEAQRDFERKAQLVTQQFIAASEGDKARALARSAAESTKIVVAQLQSAQANVSQRESVLAQARIDLARTRITSPVDGIVIKRTIEKGQTVAASLQAPELFVIAKNLRDMQVEASVDEADVGRIKTGQKASFTVDAFPGQTFEGEVRQVRKAAQNVANVVTYVAVVGFSNVGDRLLPGMTANVRVITDARSSVLKVPNAALRVRIAGVEQAPPAAAPTDAIDSGASGAGGERANAPKPSESAAGRPAGGGGGRGGPAAEFRNRLVAELALDAAQVEKVDAIYAEARPRMMQLRELREEERGKARERITADIRARIADVLTPEQKTKYAALSAESSGRQVSRGRIFLLDADGKPEAHNVRLGVSDGSSTELLGGNAPDSELKEGATVVTGTVLPGASTAGARPGSPRLPF